MHRVLSTGLQNKQTQRIKKDAQRHDEQNGGSGTSRSLTANPFVQKTYGFSLLGGARTGGTQDADLDKGLTKGFFFTTNLG